MNVVIHGLKNCDTCRKARNWLERFEVAYQFVDYRAQPPRPEQLVDWAAQLGGFPALINKASTTWRNLLPARKSPGSDAEWLLLLHEHPALIKRPVVEVDGKIQLGFSNAAFKKRFDK